MHYFAICYMNINRPLLKIKLLFMFFNLIRNIYRKLKIDENKFNELLVYRKLI